MTPVSFADWRRDMPSCKSPHFPRGFGCEGVTEANRAGYDWRIALIEQFDRICSVVLPKITSRIGLWP